MHDDLWLKLQALDTQETVRRSLCPFQSASQGGYFIVRFISEDYHVYPSQKHIFLAGSEEEQADYIHQLCILAYLISAKDTPLARSLVGHKDLAGGAFFFRGIHALPTEKLAKTFGASPQEFLALAGRFGGRPLNYGDAAIEFYLLPRLPVTFILWRGDSEFAPRASILFDKTADAQMPLDAIGAAVGLTVKKMING